MALWRAEISHDGLNKYRVITGNDEYIVNQKANAQKAIWDEMWKQRLERDRKTAEKTQRYHTKESCLSAARERTREAVDAINELGNILKETLNKDDRLVWDLLKDTSAFPKAEPVMPIVESSPDPPNEKSLMYKPQINLIDNLLTSRREKNSRH